MGEKISPNADKSESLPEAQQQEQQQEEQQQGDSTDRDRTSPLDGAMPVKVAIAARG